MSGIDRIAAEFAQAKRERRVAIVPYFVAGYPNFRRCRELLWEAQEAGASLIELGIPFSDPVADGPTLQAAIHDALERGVTVQKSLRFVQGLRREGLVVPIVGMTYANVLFAPGYAVAARRWQQAGLDGAIVPDIPAEESDRLRRAFHGRGLGTVSFASPATRPERLRGIARLRDSFLYLVAVYGTTGARKAIAPETRALVTRARRARGRTRVPVCVGFGISRPSHVADLKRAGADGVIVGSALAERILDGGSVGRFLSSLRASGKQ